MTFTRIDDFSTQSAKPGRCYVLGIPKPPEDPCVFRGPKIDFEGWLDVSARAIREAAHSLGMVDEDKAKAMQARIKELEKALEAAEEVGRHFKEQARQVIMQNAELVSELAWWEEQAKAAEDEDSE